MSTPPASAAIVPASLIVSEDEKLNIEVWYENVEALRKTTMRTECVFLSLLEIAALGTLCESVREAGTQGKELEQGFRDMVESDGERHRESDREFIAEKERQWWEWLVQSGVSSSNPSDGQSASQALYSFLRNDLFRCSDRPHLDTSGAYCDPRLAACMPFVRMLHERIEQARQALVEFEAGDAINRGTHQGVFAKMSVRSAKDVVLQQENDRLLKLWEPRLEEDIPGVVWNKYSHLLPDDELDDNEQRKEDADASGNASASRAIQQRWQCARQVFGLSDSDLTEEAPPTPFMELSRLDCLRLRDAAAVHMLETFVDASIGAFELKNATEVLWDFAKSGRVHKDVWRVLQVHFERCLASPVKASTADVSSTKDFTEQLTSPEELHLITGPKLAVILREFVPLPANSEFRIFVKNGRITCISQYDHLLYCPESIVQRKVTVLGPVLQRFVEEKVLPWCCSGEMGTERSLGSSEGTNVKLLQTDTFVLDVSVAGINENIEDHVDANTIDKLLDSVLIVEFNPFLSITSGCLFDWNVGVDREILEGNSPQVGGNGISSFEFRVVTEPLAEPVMELRRLADHYRQRAMMMLDFLWPEL